MEKKVGNYWLSVGTKSGFGIGFDISKYWIILDLGFWYVGFEF